MTSTRRHLAYVLKRFPRLSETFIAAELIELQRQGERVTVFATKRPEGDVRHAFLDELRVPIIYLPHRPLGEPLRVCRAVLRVVRRHPRGWVRAAALSLWPPRLVGVRRLLQATVLRDELARAGVDHVHAHFATTAARLANLAWRMDGPTYSVTTHAKDIWHEDVRQDHLRDKLGHATFIATVSSPNQRHLGSILDAGAPVHVVPNSVDLRRLPGSGPRQPEAGLVLTVARLVEKKGIDDLVTACAILTERGRPVRLEVVGEGPERGALEASARSLHLDVAFLGALPQEQVIERYRQAEVFCLPCVVASTGDRDGLPTAVLEAMALGVPVVTTDVNGLAEAVLNGETGLVVPEHDPEALATALQRILSNPALASELAARARSHVEHCFSLESSVARLRSLFPG